MAGISEVFSIASSGLGAGRTRLQSIATNMANARTTRTEAGGPYQRQVPVFETEDLAEGDDGTRGARVVVSEVMEDPRPPLRVHDPGHPDADADGYVLYPDINVLQEMVDLMTTSRSYEANANVVEATRDMALQALQIGR